MAIPMEMRQYNQWCLSDYNKGNNPKYFKEGQLIDLSVHDKANFMTYAKATALATRLGINYGFILTADDPFVCIDLDYVDEEKQKLRGKAIDRSKWTTSEQSSRYWAMIRNLHSYTEQSCSLKGFHIWLKGQAGKGYRRDGVEIYSQERYIACTGRAINGQAILENQQFLDNIISQMQPSYEKGAWEDSEELLTDIEIHEMALKAENHVKYELLSNGDFQNELFTTHDKNTGGRRLIYPSQSEADFALMSMFTFYSKNNEQCKRLFRHSALGQRAKSAKDDRYLDDTLQKLRNRDISETERLRLEIEQSKELIKKLNEKAAPLKEFLHQPNTVVPPSKPTTAAIFSEIYAPDRSASDNGLDWPPGFTGILAKFIYDTAPRPVKEIAISAALAFLAGICGKGWNITQSGLNLYIILIARSGVGKEAIHSGISKLVVALRTRAPYIENLIEQSEFASGQALVKHLLKQPCFLNISGEWGRKLRVFAKDDVKNSSGDSLRTKMTELYQKSGEGNIVGGMQYSKKDESLHSISSVAFSFLGETTPDTFFESLSSSMMSDGFLSRFTHIEYEGDRVPLNPNMLRQPEASIIENLVNMINMAETSNTQDIVVNVQRTASVANKVNKLEIHCNDVINSTKDESRRQLYNRASLKASKIAALLAVADNYHEPVIQDHHFDWAMHIVNRDIDISERHLRDGDIGLSDGSRQNKLNKVIRDFFTGTSFTDTEAHRRMKQEGFITRSYMQQRISASPAFEKYIGGSNRALDMTLKSMIDNGQLVEGDHGYLIREFKFNGKAYRIVEH